MDRAVSPCATLARVGCLGCLDCLAMVSALAAAVVAPVVVATVVVAAAVVAPVVVTPSLAADDPPPFVLRAGGRTVPITPSPEFVAAVYAHGVDRGLPATPPPGYLFDEWLSRPDLLARGVTIFRYAHAHALASAPKGLRVAPQEPWRQPAGLGPTLVPVFEAGAVLRVPTDELLVTFAADPGPERVRAMLAPMTIALGIRGIEPLRRACYVVALRDPAASKVFAAVRALAARPDVIAVEPNFANVFRTTPKPQPLLFVPEVSAPTARSIETPPGGKTVTASWERERREGHWVLVLEQTFEGPAPEWTVAHGEQARRVEGSVVTYRAHRGDRSVYMTSTELSGHRPPGPYPDHVVSLLRGPAFSVTAEAFVELWFRADLEDPSWMPRDIRDFGVVRVQDVETGKIYDGFGLAPSTDHGAMFDDPRTDDGWHRLLFRVPDDARFRPLQLEVMFVSDATIGAEGLYIDDIRVLQAGASPPRGPSALPGDTYAAAQWAVHADGQIAGHPARSGPATGVLPAWKLGGVREGVMVAVLDDGVEAGHPDLEYAALERSVGNERGGDATSGAPGDATSGAPGAATSGAPGERASGSLDVEIPDGTPSDASDRHGTACAGVLGARASLSGSAGLGIAGIAPGVPLVPLRRGVDDASIVRAIDVAVRLRVGVLVLPWGWNGPGSFAIEAALLEAMDAGVAVVAAAGDAGGYPPFGADQVWFPCRLGRRTPLICVGAAGPAGDVKGPASSDGRFWWTSAAGEDGPAFYAPGTWLHATDRRGPLGYGPGDWIDEFEGTGAAACVAAGVTALVVSRDPASTPAETKALLLETGVPLSSRAARGAQVLVQPEAACRAAAERDAARRQASGAGPGDAPAAPAPAAPAPSAPAPPVPAPSDRAPADRR